MSPTIRCSVKKRGYVRKETCALGSEDGDMENIEQ